MKEPSSSSQEVFSPPGCLLHSYRLNILLKMDTGLQLDSEELKHSLGLIPSEFQILSATAAHLLRPLQQGIYSGRSHIWVLSHSWPGRVLPTKNVHRKAVQVNGKQEMKRTENSEQHELTRAQRKSMFSFRFYATLKNIWCRGWELHWKEVVIFRSSRTGV